MVGILLYSFYTQERTSEHDHTRINWNMDGDLFNVQIDSYSENEEEDATLTDKEIAKFIEITTCGVLIKKKNLSQKIKIKNY